LLCFFSPLTISSKGKSSAKNRIPTLFLARSPLGGCAGCRSEKDYLALLSSGLAL
jgi:hypothetical protein